MIRYYSSCCYEEPNEDFPGVCPQCGLIANFIPNDCFECAWKDEDDHCGLNHQDCKDVKECIAFGDD